MAPLTQAQIAADAAGKFPGQNSLGSVLNFGEGGISLRDLFSSGFDPTNFTPLGALKPALGALTGDFNAFQGIGTLFGGALGGPIGAGIGGLLGGGLGGAISGTRSQRGISFPALNLDFSGLGDITELFERSPGGGTFDSFREAAGITADLARVSASLFDPIKARLDFLGLDSLSENFENQFNELSRTPGSPEEGFALNQQKFDLLGNTVQGIESLLDTAGADPAISQLFEEQSGGLSFDLFRQQEAQNFSNSIDTLRLGQRQKNLALSELNLADVTGGVDQAPATVAALASPELAGFVPVTVGDDGIQRFARFHGKDQPPEVITQDEFEALKAQGIADAITNNPERLGIQKGVDDITARLKLPKITDFSQLPQGFNFGSIQLPGTTTVAGQQSVSGQQQGATQQPIPQQPPGDPATSGGLPKLPIGQLLKLLPQEQPQQQGLTDFTLPQFDFGQLGLGGNFGVESALGGGNLITNLLGTPQQQQTLEGASGLPFSPTSGNLFSAKQRSPKGLAFLS